MSEETKRSPSHAPDYVLHRYLTGASDTLPESRLQSGINMLSYRFANIQVVPDAAADPAIKIQFWSPKKNEFIDSHMVLSFASKGVGKSYEVTVECNGRQMFVAVPSGVTTGQECWVYVSGFEELRK